MNEQTIETGRFTLYFQNKNAVEEYESILVHQPASLQQSKRSNPRQEGKKANPNLKSFNDYYRQKSACARKARQKRSVSPNQSINKSVCSIRSNNSVVNRQFKAKEAPKFDIPFVVFKSRKPLTEFQEFDLRTEK